MGYVILALKFEPFVDVTRFVVRMANNPASILYKSTAGRYWPFSYPDGPITARYRFT